MVLKLPRWAQEHIQHINRLRFQAEQKLKEYRDSLTPSPVYVREPLTENKHFLQTDSVTFEVDGGTLEACVDDGNLTVRGSGIRSSLAVRPHVSNVVSIGLVE